MQFLEDEEHRGIKGDEGGGGGNGFSGSGYKLRRVNMNTCTSTQTVLWVVPTSTIWGK